MYLLHGLLEKTAIRSPASNALLFKDDRLTYEELNCRANQLANLIICNGIKSGDRVGVFFDKSIEQAVAIWAIAKAGAIFIVLNSLLKEAAIRYIMIDCGMAAVFTSGLKLKKFSLCGIDSLKTCFVLKPVLFESEKSIQYVNIANANNLSGLNPDVAVDEDDLAAIIYTSGSTGMPKGVMLTHKNVTLGAYAVSEYLKIRSDDRLLSLLPFSFDYGLNQMTTAVKEGALLVLKNYVFPEEIIEVIEGEKITGLAGIPTIWIQLLQTKNIGKYPLSHFRYITNSGDRLSVTHVRALQKAFPHTSIYLMYGLTEAFRATYLDPKELGARPESIGKAIPYAEVFVVDSDGREAKPNEVGELVQGGVLVSKGYWGKPVETAEKIKPHPFKKDGGIVCYSGDLVRRDEEGFIYYVGRNSAMIKCLGHRISPTEIEAELYKHEEVKHAIAFGEKDELIGEKIIVIVTLKTNSKANDKSVLDFCRRSMPHYMLPARVVIVDSLPLTSSGKLDRPAIASIYGAHHAD